MAPPTEFSGSFDATSLITVICAALAGYNAFELILLILTTFRNYHGLYFWSIVVASCSIFPYVIGMLLMYFYSKSSLAGLIINNLGWIAMIVAQSVVLYSRLGIVLGNQRSGILVFTKWMIIIDAIIFYTLATVTVFGMHYSSNPHFARGYIYTERLQMTGFCIQEFIISGLYIWKTLDILQAGEKKEAHRTLWQLFIINIVIVALDVALLVLEYLGLASFEIAFKPLAYSCKLKMEFAILSKLVESSSLAQRNLSMSLSQTIALDEDRLSANPRSILLSSSSPLPPRRFAASGLSRWQKGEKRQSIEHTEHHSHESIRSSSHQTGSSETYLAGSTSTQITPVTPGRSASDPYHRMVKAISTS